MIYLYDGGGAGITEYHGPALPDNEWARIRTAAVRVLRARGYSGAASALDANAFELLNATNYFEDEFSALRLTASLDQYVELSEIKNDKTRGEPFRRIAETISELGPFVRFIVVQMATDEEPLPVSTPSPKITTEAVESALADAELLLRSRGPASAMDRAHTAMHGYLRAALERVGQAPASTASATELFKQLRAHSLLAEFGVRTEETRRIVMSLAAVVDAANTLRNTASGAHPTGTLEAPEAMLVINAVRSLIHYLDDRLASEDR